MITPFERLVEYAVPPKSNYRCLELSPDGSLFAAVTVSAIQILSVYPTIRILASVPHHRPAGYSKALLNRIFLLWRDNSREFIVVRSEGAVDFYRLTVDYRSLEDMSEDSSSPISYVSVGVNKSGSFNIDQYGYPLSACLLSDNIFIVYDSGSIAVLNWNGNILACPLHRFIPESLLPKGYSLQKRHAVSISSISELCAIALALDDGSCFLLEIPPSSRLPVRALRFHVNTEDGVRMVTFCPGMPLLAVTSSHLSVNIYSIKRSADWFAAEPITTIDIRQYPQLNLSPLYSYDMILCVKWCPGVPVLALGMKYQGIMVWDIHGNMLFSYSGPSLPVLDQESGELGHEVSCCCFNMQGTALLFNIPYEQVIHGVNNEVFVRESRLLCQRFVVTSDFLTATESCACFGYSSTVLVQIHNETNSSLAVLPSVIPLPLSFISNQQIVLGHASSPSGSSFLLFTPSSLCLYQGRRAKFIVANNLITEGLITAVEWFSETVILLAVSPFHMTKPGALLYALNIHDLSIQHALQEVELNFKGPVFTPSQSGLLPCTMPTASFPYISSIHVADSHILCCTTHRLYYVLYVPETENWNLPSITRLPMQFVTKGSLHTDWWVRRGIFVTSERMVQFEGGETKRVQCNDILVWAWDNSVLLSHLTEDAKDSLLFPLVQQIVLCDYRDRGVLQNPMNLDSFLLFCVNNTQTAWFPAHSSLPFSACSGAQRLIQSQASGSIWGFFWSKCALLSMPPVFNDSSSSERLSLRSVVVSAFHLLLIELLHVQQLGVASGYLQHGLSLSLPGLIASLEFMLHYALNCGESSFLSATLQLLSQLPFFSHILVRCLRKQERSMWPFAVQNAEDIKVLYRQFLLNNDMEYAVTTISILQGLLCSVGDGWVSKGEEKLKLEMWKKVLHGEEDWLVDDYSEVFCCEIENECIAHISGLQLLLVAIIREEYALLGDIDRFLLMEEARHEETEKPIPAAYLASHVLTVITEQFFYKGHIASLVKLLRNVEFEWSFKGKMEIEDYAKSLDVIIKGSKWTMFVNENEELVSEAKDASSVSEEDLEYLLHRFMMADCAEWSLLLMLVLLKMKQLTSFAVARSDLWQQCVDDFSDSSNDLVKQLLSTVQQTIHKQIE